MAFKKYNLTPEVQSLIDWDAEHMAHWVTPFGGNAGFLVDHADGVSIYDSEGFEILDGSSQLMCVELGYRKEYMEEMAEAIAEQVKKLPFCTNFWGFANEATAKAGQALIEIVPEGLEVFWFTPGGAESIETALSMCRWYWKNQGTQKYKIITLQNSYHGLYYGSASATNVGNGHFTNAMSPMVPGFIKAPDYYCYRCPIGHKYPECGIECAKQIEKIIGVEDPDSVAAVLLEVEHGTAGCIPAPPEYLPMVREICTRNDVSLIVDEVMTGFGRCSVEGEGFACQNFGITPDFMAMAKGITSAYIPMGAVGVTREIADGLEGSMIGGATYSGHPVASAAAAKCMEIYKRDKIFEHAAEIGKYAKKRLDEQFVENFPLVDHVSGYGMLLGIEVVKDKATKEAYPPKSLKMLRLQERALDKGLFVRICDQNWAPGNRIMFCPPLVSTEKDIDRMLDRLYDAFADELKDEMG
ncbi:MAG: aspartate aminotransferase family protein [Deltaproteobacteria bacterium]|nr:aspartate aminotransferase family protein [Deltaproteobacteria bacterium]